MGDNQIKCYACLSFYSWDFLGQSTKKGARDVIANFLCWDMKPRFEGGAAVARSHRSDEVLMKKVSQLKIDNVICCFSI